MKTLRLKSILFSLLALSAVILVMTSCEQESLKDITEQIDTNLEEGHACSGCMIYSTEEPDEIVDVLIKYGEDSEPVYEKAARYGEVVVYGGDVVLTQNYSDEITLRGTIISNLSLRWDNSTIPYTFGGGLSAQEQAAVLSAIQYINDETNLCVVERTNETDYMVFEDNSIPGQKPLGCFVRGIGNTGGAQTVNLGPGCGSQRVIVHEVLHKAGFFHEQVRSDRDNFITVNTNNFDNSNGTCWSCQFNKSANATAFGAYDFASIMHYPQYFADATINDNQPMYYINQGVSLPAGMTASQIGTSQNMSATDIAAVNSLYSTCGGGGGDCDTPSASGITYDDFGSVIYLYTQNYNGVNHQFRYRANGGAWIELQETTLHYSAIPNAQAAASYEAQLKLCGDNWSDTKVIRGNGGGGGEDCDTPSASGITYDDFGSVIYLYTQSYNGINHQFRYRANGGAWVELQETTLHYSAIPNAQAAASYEAQLKLCGDNWSDTKVIRGNGGGDDNSCDAPSASDITYGAYSTVIYLYAQSYNGVNHQFRYRINGGAWVEMSATTNYYNTITNVQSCANYEVQLKESCSSWSASKTFSSNC